MSPAEWLGVLVAVVLFLSLFAGLLTWVALLAVEHAAPRKVWRNDELLIVERDR